MTSQLKSVKHTEEVVGCKGLQGSVGDMLPDSTQLRQGGSDNCLQSQAL